MSNDDDGDVKNCDVDEYVDNGDTLLPLEIKLWTMVMAAVMIVRVNRSFTFFYYSYNFVQSTGLYCVSSFFLTVK